MHVVEYWIGESITHRTHVLDHDRKHTLHLSNDLLDAILIVFQILQRVQRLPFVIVLIDDGEIVGLERLPVEPCAQCQYYKKHIESDLPRRMFRAGYARNIAGYCSLMVYDLGDQRMFRATRCGIDGSEYPSGHGTWKPSFGK